MKLAWGAQVSPQFRSKVVAICQRLGIADPSWLMACIAFESGFNPQARNASTGATGLIQFMPNTAVGLGTSVDVIGHLTAEEQLPLVERYFQPYAGRLHSLGDTYMAILYPEAIGQPDDHIIFPAGSKAAAQNRGLDLDHDNAVTKAEAVSFVASRLNQGLQASNVFDYVGEEQPAAPIEEHSIPVQPTEGGPMGAFLIPLVTTLLQSFAPLAQEKLSKELNRHTDNPDVANSIATGVMAAVAKATNQSAEELTTDPKKALAAVAAVQADPAKVQQVEQDSLAHLNGIMPALDKLAQYDSAAWEASIRGKDAAAARALKEKWDMAPTLVKWTLGLMTVISVGLVGGIGLQLYFDKPTDVLIAMAGPILTLIAKGYVEMIAYRFDSTPNSSAKDQLIAELAKTKVQPSV